VSPGEIVLFEPNELHGMRADAEEVVLLATITPRPGDRGRATSEPRTGSASWP
jgi:quercetin dioxygenase-like cupin family protein